jgi:hypothetical protein
LDFRSQLILDSFENRGGLVGINYLFPFCMNWAAAAGADLQFKLREKDKAQTLLWKQKAKARERDLSNALNDSELRAESLATANNNNKDQAISENAAGLTKLTTTTPTTTSISSTKDKQRGTTPGTTPKKVDHAKAATALEERAQEPSQSPPNQRTQSQLLRFRCPYHPQEFRTGSSTLRHPRTATKRLYYARFPHGGASVLTSRTV